MTSPSKLILAAHATSLQDVMDFLQATQSSFAPNIATKNINLDSNYEDQPVAPNHRRFQTEKDNPTTNSDTDSVPIAVGTHTTTFNIYKILSLLPMYVSRPRQLIKTRIYIPPLTPPSKLDTLPLILNLKYPTLRKLSLRSQLITPTVKKFK